MTTYLSFGKTLRQESDADIISNLLRKGWVESPSPSFNPETESCEWIDGYWVVSPITVENVASITPRQMRLWLLGAGNLVQVRAFINQQGEAAMIEWEFAMEIKRDNPLTLAVQSLLRLTDAQLNQAFKEASLL